MEEIKEELEEIKSWASWICLWMFITMIAACGSCSQLAGIADSLKKIELVK